MRLSFLTLLLLLPLSAKAQLVPLAEAINQALARPRIVGLTLYGVPETNRGARWDTFGQADPFVVISDAATGQRLFQSPAVEEPDRYPVEFLIGLDVADVRRPLRLTLFDEDARVHDAIASYVVSLDGLPTFPPEYVLYGANGQPLARLSLTWSALNGVRR